MGSDWGDDVGPNWDSDKEVEMVPREKTRGDSGHRGEVLSLCLKSVNTSVQYTSPSFALCSALVYCLLSLI